MAGFMILVSFLAAGSFAKRIATNQVQLQKEAVSNEPSILPASVHPALPLRTAMMPQASMPVVMSMQASGNARKYPAELRTDWDGLRTSNNVWMGAEMLDDQDIAAEKAGAESGGDEAKENEKFGHDPRPLSLQVGAWSGDPAADWVVPATGTLGKIASVPELDAALAAAKGKVVVIKFFAPWCSSCKAIEKKFARTAKAIADAADFYAVDFSTTKPYCKASGISFMPAVHIYVDGVFEESMSLGPKVFGKFAKRLKELSAASGGESDGQIEGEGDGDSPVVELTPFQVAASEADEDVATEPDDDAPVIPSTPFKIPAAEADKATA